MSNVETPPIEETVIEETNVEETNVAIVLDVLVEQIAEISREVENLPLGGEGDSSNDRIMAMQNVDLCSQRLRDISKVMQNLINTADLSAVCTISEILDDIWLEHTQDAIKERR